MTEMDWSQGLRMLRAATGMTRPELAKEVGAPYWTLTQWEQGKHKPDRRYQRTLRPLLERHNIHVTAS